MTDREKVIEGLECCIDDSRTSCSGCYQQGPGFGIECRKGLMHDALVLLKEQKGVPYVFDADGETVCGVCGCYFDKAYSNCPKCGKKVDWNG